MKIKAIEINNFIGIKELKWNPTPGVNVIEGPKGTGKTSILEAIEAAFANIRRRTEVISHSEDEATLLIATDTGLEIDRRLRDGKADYMKLRQEGKGINSTEKELRQFVHGDIFRPLDFINMDIKEQTKIILSMIEVNWTMEDILKWFGEEILGINYDKHILQILKDIETKLFKEREESNRQVKTLEIQCDSIKKELPPNYDGEEWRVKNIQEFYNKVAEAQKINQFIEQAKALKENYDDRVKAIKADADNEKSRVSSKFRESRIDIKDIVDLSNSKISKAQNDIKESVRVLEEEKTKIDTNTQIEIEKAIKAIKDEAEAKKKALMIETVDKELDLRDLINLTQNKISAKEQELTGLDELEKAEIKAVDEKVISETDKEKIRVGKAADYLEKNEPIDIKPIQDKANEVAEMQSYLREWDRMKIIMDGDLSEKKGYAKSLTNKIETARNKPSELLKTHKLPIDGISVDENGLIRINGTLLDGLSSGEKLEAAFKIALQRMGELKIICLDEFQKLNKSEQNKITKLCEDNDIQAFVTITEDKESGEFEFNKEGK